MFAIDTSSLIAYLAGSNGRDVEAVEVALKDGNAVLPPAVISEILSDPKLPIKVEKIIVNMSSLPITDGYWLRVAKNRKSILQKKRKARLADSLIAQSCIDYGLVLITRDSDFKAFSEYCNLKLY